MKNKLVSDFVKSFYGGNHTELVKSMNLPKLQTDLFEGNSPVELHELFGSSSEGNINFYPSPIKGGCYETAVFVSLSKPPNDKKIKKNNLVPLDKILKKMVQQVLGSCDGINQEIILITDEINTTLIKEWEGNLKAIKKRCNSLEIYYLFPDGETKIVNDFFGV